MPLDRLSEREGRSVPSCVALLCAYLCEGDRLESDGIFRLSAAKSEVQALASRIDANDIAVLESCMFLLFLCFSCF